MNRFIFLDICAVAWYAEVKNRTGKRMGTVEPKLLTANRFVDGRTGCSYRYVKSETEYFRPHYHDYFELFLVLDGTIPHSVNGVLQQLSPGTLVLIRPQDTHDYLRVPGKEFGFVNLCFTREIFREIADFLGEGFPAGSLLNAPLPPVVTPDPGAVQHLTRRMSALCVVSDDSVPQLRFRMRALLFEILTRHFSSFKETSPESAPPWLEQLAAEMQRNRNFAGGMERMIQLSGKSREHLARSIRRYYHKSASEFINDLRLIYLANMLRNSNHPIVELCYDSGFQNVGWAYTLFRRRYGVSPRQYRAQK